MPDPRKRGQCVYSAAHLVWDGVLMFMSHLESRRQLRREQQAAPFALNLQQLSGQSDVKTTAHPDSLAYYAERVSRRDLEVLLASLTTRLIRSKALDAFRLNGGFTVAVDGTQVCTFDQSPWPGCPSRKLSDGSIQYFAYVLDAKLVTPNGMALTLATEMLTNENHQEFDKQDCELKAFYRLVPKLKALFPRTPLILLLDALYANQNVIRLVEANRWTFIINFKEGSMPERFAEARALMNLQTENRLHAQWHKADQRFRWVQDLPVAEHKVQVIECVEQHPDKKEATSFVWMTNSHVCKNNVQKIANQGGRLRWKIENEGFNVQKNDGYHMRHPFSEHSNGFAVFYILLLIAHYLSQLILHGSLIESLARSFGSAKNFARRLAESLRHYIPPVSLPIPGQIRFQPP
jgi:hypothetical protein